MPGGDKIFMREALLEAEKAFEKGEVPVGAIITCQDAIVARAHNLVEEKRDASAHAELLCMRSAADALGGWRLSGCTLYSTLELCPMCAGSALLFRVDRVVYGAPDLRHGADGTQFSVLRGGYPIHEVEVSTGVLGDEAAGLMKRFFQERREDGRRVISRASRCAAKKDVCLCQEAHSQYNGG